MRGGLHELRLFAFGRRRPLGSGTRTRERFFTFRNLPDNTVRLVLRWTGRASQSDDLDFEAPHFFLSATNQALRFKTVSYRSV
jgi:hypothetical protein